MHKSLLALATAGALALVPAAAHAATGGTTTLDKPFKWSGGPGQGIVLPFVFSQVEEGPVSEGTTACTQVETCDNTLVTVGAADAGNDLVFSLNGDNGDTPTQDPIFGGADIDLYVFKANADGTAGEAVGQSINEGAVESVTLNNVEAGRYFVQARFYHAVNATYDAAATLSVPVPPEDEETGDEE